jgi:ABC-type multidrug transport system fused ATPase/permease subunit
MNKLKVIFKENWKQISLSYVLFTAQSIFILLYPKVLGNFIDKLIEKDYSYVIWLLATFFGVVALNYVSRIYDTIVFSKIYRRFASIETSNQFDNGVDISKINGRLDLMRGVVSFFEHNIIAVLNCVYSLLGSIYFITLADAAMVPYLVLSGLCTIMVTYYFSPKIAAVTKDTNDLTEQQTSIIEERNVSTLNNFLRRRQKLAVAISNLDAKFYSLVQIIAYGTVTLLTTYYVIFNDVTVGGVFSTYRYLFDFCNSVSSVPFIMISFINIRDVIKRLENQN